MIFKIHYVELWINGQLAELESQDSLNLRIDNVLFEPAKTVTRQVEYNHLFSELHYTSWYYLSMVG